MTYAEAKEIIKPMLPQYVEKITTKSPGQSGNYNCPLCGSGTGAHKTGAFSVYDDGTKWKCFSCNKGGDIFDLVGEVEKISRPVDQLLRAARICGVQIDPPAAAPASATGTKPKPNATPAAAMDIEIPAADLDRPTDYTSFFEECEEYRGCTSYMDVRGIPRHLQERFHIGFCPKWVSPKAKAEGKNPPPTARVIIPTSKYSYLARAVDDENGGYAKLKVGKTTPFNNEILTTATKPIFIVEGEIDALSIMTVGGEAIGLGSINMVDRFLTDYVDKNPPTQPLIVALDNDGNENTIKASKKLVKGLKERNIICVTFNVAGDQKDANDLLFYKPGMLDMLVAEGEEKARKAVEESIAERYKEYSMQHRSATLLPDLIANIKGGTTTKIQCTGFWELDEALGGGLDSGLCFMGAISSLGKTTFILQLADQMAAQGRDILFFTLEMPREELISKSLSRYTLVRSFDEDDTTMGASSNRNILRNFDTLNPRERKCLDEAAADYKQIAGNIYFFEGVGDIGTETIRSCVKEHVELTGKTPIIFVDYLQILAPYSDRLTDKQNTDRSVIELKRISRDYDTIVIGVSSFNRESYTAPVSMASFKESGAIEYSADVLLGLQYDGMDIQKGESRERRVTRVLDLLEAQKEIARRGEAQDIQIKILKNRNGSRGSVTMKYFPMFNAFIGEPVRVPF